MSEFAAVIGQAGADRQPPGAPLCGGVQQLDDRAADQAIAEQGGQGQRQDAAGENEQHAHAGGLGGSGERDLRVQFDRNCQPDWFDTRGRKGGDAHPAIKAACQPDRSLIAFKAETVFRLYRLAHPMPAVWTTGQHDAVAIRDPSGRSRRQHNPAKLLTEPIQAERDCNNPGDGPVPIPECLGDLDNRLC